MKRIIVFLGLYIGVPLFWESTICLEQPPNLRHARGLSGACAGFAGFRPQNKQLGHLSSVFLVVEPSKIIFLI